MAEKWNAYPPRPASRSPRPAPKPTTITEAARRYHACAQALAATLGLSLAEVLAAHRESVTAIYIEVSKCEVRLPAGVQLPHVMRAPLEPARGAPEALPLESNTRLSHAFPTSAEESSAEPAATAPEPEEPAPTVIPPGLPCSGTLLVDLKPAQLSLLLGKLAHLAEANGSPWITLLQALRDERAARLAKGRKPRLVPGSEATAGRDDHGAGA